MKGLMFTEDHASNTDNEYIVVEELGSIVALMHTTTQNILWVTLNVLQRDYSQKKAEERLQK